MTNRLINLAFFTLLTVVLPAQDRPNFSITAELGTSLSGSDSEGLSFLLGIEPKVEILRNTYAMIGFGFITNVSSYLMEDPFRYAVDTRQDNAAVFFNPGLRYYPGTIQIKGHGLAPYLGSSMGYYLLRGVEVLDVVTEETLGMDIKNRVGFDLQVGFEARQIKLGVEYSLIPDGNLHSPSSDASIGVVENSFWAVTLGYVFNFK